MPPHPADRNLLFGILALQMDFITRDELVEAMNAWVLDKSKSLGDLLIARKALTETRRRLLDSLVEEHTAEHGSVAQSLARLAGHADTAQSLAVIDDGELQASLAQLANVPAIDGTKPDRSLDDSQRLSGAAKPGSGTAAVAEQAATAEHLGNESAEIARKAMLARLMGDPRLASTEEPEIPSELSSISTVDRGDHKAYFFGPYELHERIGKGGMGIVFRATHEQLKRVCALKMIKSGELSSKREIERFQQEAKAAARLDHPGIVPIFDIGVHKGQHYFAMAYVPGESLAQCVRNGPLEPNLAADLVRQAAVAVQHAHERGIVHRDLKPANILLEGVGNRGSGVKEKKAVAPAAWDPSPDSPVNTPNGANRAPGTPSTTPNPKSRNSSSSFPIAKITDFGLAKRLDDDVTHLTKTGDVMGTPAYMAPEQASGQKNVGPAADVYGLGAVLYHLLTGRPPFQAANTFETINQVLNQEPVSVGALNPAVARDLQTICHKCLQKEPQKRYETAADLAEDLTRLQHGEPITARPINALERSFRWAKRRPAIAGLSAGILLAVLAGIAVSSTYAIRSANLAKEKEGEARRANIQAQLAKDNEATAKKSEAKATAAQRDSEAQLYHSNMLLAQSAWESNQICLMKELLDRYDRKYAQGEDPRGFEWHYWRARLQDDLLTLPGHSAAVMRVCFSPDGARLASASVDKTIKLWNARTGALQTTLVGFSDLAQSGFCVSPDGARLASASGDKTIKIWDARTSALQTTLRGHSSEVTGVSFSPDGARLASASYDKTIRLWDARTGELQATLQGHTEYVWSVSFSPDGARLASASEDRTIKLWDTRTGVVQATLQADRGRPPALWYMDRVTSVCFSPDGARLASTSWDKTIKLWNARTGAVQATFQGHSGVVTGVCFSPDGTRLASASEDRTIKLWDARTGAVRATFQGHSGVVAGVCFSPDGTRLASASYDNTIKLWDARTGVEQAMFDGHTDTLNNICFSLNGTGGSKTEVFKKTVNSVCFSPDGARLASASSDSTIKLWDAGTGVVQATLQGHSAAVTSVCFSPDGARLASASWDSTIKLWDARTGAVQATLNGHSDKVNSVCFSLDGARLASASYDETIKLWDARTGTMQATLNGRSAKATSVCFSPDGTRLASPFESPLIKLWDARTGVLQATHWEASADSGRGRFNGNSAVVHSVCFSPDGAQLATASYDQTIKLWDAGTGVVQATLQGHSGAVTSVCFSPDGARLASASFDKTIKLWDARSGSVQATLQGHSDAVTSVCFSPDGAQLASALGDGTIQLWDARTDAKAKADKLVRRTVAELFALPLTRAEMIRHLESNAILPDELKPQALAIARATLEDWQRFANAALRYSLFETATPAVRRRAVELAMLACKLSGDADQALTALAAAQYRLGDQRQAVATIQRRRANSGDAETMCIEAMAWKATGDDAKALTMLAMARHRGAAVPENERRGFELIFAEATNCVFGPASPAARFAQLDGAIDLAERLLKELVLKADVKARMEADGGRSDEQKCFMLVALELLPEPSAGVLNLESWNIVIQSSLPTAEYLRALRWAAAAVAKDPKNGAYLNTLGVAFCRAGQYDEALATLTKSEKMNANQGVADPTDLAFLAIAQYKLGKPHEAKATLERCRQSIKQPTYTDDQEARKFLAEAAAVIEGNLKK